MVRKFFLWIVALVFAIISIWTAMGKNWQTAILTGIIFILIVLLIRARKKKAI